MNSLFDLTEEAMEKAFYSRDPGYDGLFFIGVRTTGIFCRTVCTAKKPKRENIEFFKSIKAALDSGYRPCKICCPLEPRGSTPAWVKTILELVGKNPAISMKDSEIRAQGTDPVRLRRWFMANYGITFQAYLRALRIGDAFGRIKLGEKVIDAAYDSGYESLSGFNAAYKKIFETAPRKSEVLTVIKTTRLTTPLGPMLAGATMAGICLLEFTDRRMIEAQFRQIARIFKARCMPGTSPHLFELQKELDEYFAGTRKEFTVPLVTNGTEFQEKVWNELRKIPYGKTISYGKQAQNIGKPEAVRAVARANGENRIAILIPCHRVIGENGSLTGYGSGLWRKKYLLDLELKTDSSQGTGH